MIFCGERNFHVLGVASLAAYQLFFEAGDELSAAQNEGLVLRGAAVELLVFAPAFVVQNDGVAVLSCSLHGDEAGVSLLHRLEFAFDVLFVEFLLGDLRLNALVILDDYFRSDSNGNGDFEALALFQLFFAESQVRSVDGLQSQFFQRLGITGSQAVIYRVFEEDAFSVSLLDDTAGRLALAESRHFDLASLFSICLIESSIEFLCSECHGKFGHIVLFAY